MAAEFFVISPNVTGEAPNSRRVRIFAAEKGIELDIVPVDLSSGEHMRAPYRDISADLVVPVLELDDGTRIGESVAICRYLDEIQPEPPLFGVDALDRATVETWHRRVEFQGFMAAAEALRNRSKFFENRALSGPVNYAQIPELAERGRQRVAQFFTMLDTQLAASEHVAGDRFSIADITALVVVDFASRTGSARDDMPAAMAAWHARVAARPSVGA